MKDAKSIEKAGSFAIVLECLSPYAAKLITKELKILTIGIGSSVNCDGQILVTDDMLGISGFYPKFVKKYTNLNRIIEKAIKKYTREVKLKKFPTKKIFYMEQSLENRPDLKNRIIRFYNLHKKKILIFIFILIIVLTTFIFLKYKSEKNNILIAEKYIEAGLNLSSNNKDNARKTYEEIILKKNKFYSILALNTVIEKNLIVDKEKILKYFEILEKSSTLKEQKDLIVFKKSLYLIKEGDFENGKNLLEKLISNDSALKSIAKELIQN